MGNAETLERALRHGRWLVIRCHAPVPLVGRCGHEAAWPAQVALATFGARAHRYDLARKLRCSHCRAKGQVELGVR